MSGDHIGGKSAGGTERAGTPERVGIDELLERVRAGYERIGPQEAAAAATDGALLVDIRYAALRERDGLIPGALVVERNELEWRLDPPSGSATGSSPARSSWSATNWSGGSTPRAATAPPRR